MTANNLNLVSLKQYHCVDCYPLTCRPEVKSIKVSLASLSIYGLAERAEANNVRDVGRVRQMQSVSSSEGVDPILLAPATRSITVRRTKGFTDLDRADASNARDVSRGMQLQLVSRSMLKGWRQYSLRRQRGV